MNVLYLYDNLPAYRKDFFKLLSEKLLNNGDNLLLGFGQNKELKLTSKQLVDIPFNAIPLPLVSSSLLRIQRLKGLISLIDNYKPDVIVLQFHVAVLSYWRMFFHVKRKNIPYIIWDCNYTRDNLNSTLVKFRQLLVDFTYKKAFACITYGSVFSNYLLKLGIKENRIIIAQNTINIEKIHQQRSQKCAIRTFDNPIRFLYVGALIHRKFVISAVQAAQQLLEEGISLVFDIVGDGEEYNTINNYIIDNNLTSFIILHGAKYGKELNTFFENDDVFILPGTGGLAINEAMAYSMPIISTNGDDTVFDLIDGNGFMLNNMGDIDEIKSTMKLFIDLSVPEKKIMAYKSEEIILKKASLDNMVNRHIEAINIVKNDFSKTKRQVPRS